MNTVCTCDEPHYKCRCTTLQSSRHNVTARLGGNEYGQIARYAACNGVQFDVAVQQIVIRGLIQVAIEEAKAEKKRRILGGLDG